MKGRSKWKPIVQSVVKFSLILMDAQIAVLISTLYMVIITIFIINKRKGKRNMSLDLRDCVVGDKLLTRGGEVLTYVEQVTHRVKCDPKVTKRGVSQATGF